MYWSNIQAATLNASVDRTTIEDGDVVQLMLEVEGRNADRPDTAALQKDFEILGTSNMTQMRFVNGHATSLTQWILNLRPRRLGLLTIPAMQTGGARSQPIEIHVGTSQRSQGSNPDIFLQTEVSPATPYLQAQLNYTIRLYSAVPLKSGELSEPKSPAFLIQRAGKDRETTVTRNGRRYRVIERRYAMFAQQSGSLTIEAPVFEGQILDSRGQRQRFGLDPFNGLFTGTRPVRVRGESRDITVQPRPDSAQGQHWIPAQSLELSGEWKPDQVSMKVGEPVTLTMKISVRGLTAAQLPEFFNDQLDGFHVYPDHADGQTSFDPQAIAVATRVQKIAFIPQHAGDVTIPEIALHWWNTQTNQQEIARLPGITRSVKGDGTSTAQPALSTTSLGSVALPAQPSSGLANATANQQPATSEQLTTTRLWIWICAALVTVWVVTITMWIRDRRKLNHPALNQTHHHQSSGDSEKSARARILAACTNGDPSAVRRALLAWGAIHWRENPPRGLEQLSQRIDNQTLTAVLTALDRALYTEATQWNPSELKSLLSALPTEKSNASSVVRSALPSHYAQVFLR